MGHSGTEVVVEARLLARRKGVKLNSGLGGLVVLVERREDTAVAVVVMLAGKECEL